MGRTPSGGLGLVGVGAGAGFERGMRRAASNRSAVIWSESPLIMSVISAARPEVQASSVVSGRRSSAAQPEGPGAAPVCICLRARRRRSGSVAVSGGGVEVGRAGMGAEAGG